MTRNLFIAVAGLALLSACNSGASTPEKTVQQLMADDVNPTAYRYWDSVQFGSDLERGQYKILPTTDEDWQRAKDAATRLGELGRLLKSPGYAEGRGEDWLEFSDGLTEVSQLAEQAVDARDTDKMFQVGGTIYSVCEACHQFYPPAEGLPEESAAEAPPA